MGVDLSRRVLAEFFGTFWLVLGGCGAAVLAAGFPQLGIAFVGVALAFGLTVLTMAYAVGHISGGHFNPAVTVGLWSAGRCAAADVIPYIVAQLVGAIVAAGVLWLIASSQPGWVPGGFAANGYGDLSPGKYALAGCFLTELVMTFFFLFIIIWLVWLAPILGAVIAGLFARWMYEREAIIETVVLEETRISEAAGPSR